MPLFDFACEECNVVLYDQYRNHSEMHVEAFPHCPKCGEKTKVMYQTVTHSTRNFEAQWVRDIDDKPVFVRNRSELRDAIERHNDTELASKQGRLRTYEPKLTRREV